jgi:hypothetical protein
MTSIDEDPYIKAREYSRVDACVPFQYRPVPCDGRDVIRSRLVGKSAFIGSSDLPELENEVLAQWLKSIQGKLDAIIELLTEQREGFASLPMRRVNISGGGMCFATTERFEPGGLLELQMKLHTNQPVALYIFGEIVHCEELDGCFQTAVRFVHADEEVINAIVKFVFEIQREILREKRR